MDKKVKFLIEEVLKRANPYMMNSLQKFLKKFNKGYYNYLLISLVLLFVFRPYQQDLHYIAVWKSLLTIVFIAAIFNCKHHRTVRRIIFVLAIPTLILGWLELLHPHYDIYIPSVILTIIFMWLCTISILYDVLLRAKVTLETLRGVVCVYFMIAFAFAYMYYFTNYIFPGSFHLIYADIPFASHSRILAELMYFSFITLLTVGYGDITPTKDIAQTLVVLQATIGQFYVAILVARIVAVYSFFSDKRLLKKLESDINKLK